MDAWGFFFAEIKLSIIYTAINGYFSYSMEIHVYSKFETVIVY